MIPRASVDLQDSNMLPPLVAIKNVVSTSFLLSWWTRYNWQEPTILTVSFVYVPISNLLDTSFLNVGFLNTNLYTLTGMMLTSAHVSNLALKYMFLV